MVEKHRAEKVVGSLRKLTGITETEPKKQVVGIRRKIKKIPSSRIDKEIKRVSKEHGINANYYRRLMKSLSEDPPTKTKRMLYHLYKTKTSLTTRQLYRKMGIRDANELVNLFKEIRLIKKIEQGNSFKQKPSLITEINRKTIKELYPEVHKWEKIKKPVIKRGEVKWSGTDTMKTGIDVFDLDVETHYQLRGKHLPKLIMKKEHRQELKRRGVKRWKTLESLRQRAMEGELLERVGKTVPPGEIFLTDKQVQKIKNVKLKDLPKKWKVKAKELEEAKQNILKRRRKKIPKTKRIPRKAKLILKLLETNMKEINAKHLPELEKISKKGLNRKELIKKNIAVGDTNVGTNTNLLMKKAVENEILTKIGKTIETLTKKDMKKIQALNYEEIIPEKSSFTKTKFANTKEKLVEKAMKNA